MPVRIKQDENAVTAYLVGEIDHHSAKRMREEIDRTIESARPSLLILDFSQVTFMDSSGIGLVMGRYKALTLSGGQSMEVRGVSNQTARVMKLAGLDKLAKINVEGKQ
ncbi:MAG TPA: STAS domain-containing protein [Firmicutes bacterium]|nr:STAS domain-containing protein [Bacillota bacterium]